MAHAKSEGLTVVNYLDISNMETIKKNKYSGECKKS